VSEVIVNLSKEIFQPPTEFGGSMNWHVLHSPDLVPPQFDRYVPGLHVGHLTRPHVPGELDQYHPGGDDSPQGTQVPGLGPGPQFSR
jgi:hypothetical protein